MVQIYAYNKCRYKNFIANIYTWRESGYRTTFITYDTKMDTYQLFITYGTKMNTDQLFITYGAKMNTYQLFTTYGAKMNTD